MAQTNAAPIGDLSGFILELTLALRQRGLVIAPADAAQAAKLIHGEELSPAQLVGILKTTLVRKPTDVAIFEAEFTRLTELLSRKLVWQPSSPPPLLPLPRSPPPPPPQITWVEWLRVRFLAAFALLRELMFRIKAVHFGWWLVGIAAIAVVLLPVVPRTPQDICALVPCPVDSEVQVASLASMLLAFVISLAAIPAAYLVRRWTLGHGKEVPEALGIMDVEAEADASGNDETSFRVTVLGGRPARFLEPVLATQIIELIGYRDAGEDVRRIDLKKTIERMVRGGDSAALYAARRRELPQIILVTDQASPARFYNTLAEEFAEILLARGIVHERMSFAGSFHGHDGRLKPAHRELGQLLDGLGWQVLCLFGELHGLSDLDQRFLSRLAEQGPVLFLDYRDSLLWDMRHKRFATLHANILLEPATGAGLLKGIERIFVPGTDRRGDQQAPAHAAGLKDWVEECALVEPMSYALAEKLRKRHVVNHRSLSYSLAAAQPGSWLGPEGLRFAPQHRYRLLDAFARRPKEDRQQVLAIINDAFAHAKAEGVTANAIKDYAQAQANVFMIDTDEAAIGTILRAEQEGHVDPMVVTDFRSRLRSPSIGSEAGTVRLPGLPLRAKYRAMLSEQSLHRDPELKDINAARWGIGSPQVRIEASANPTDRKAPLALFIPDAQTLLIAAEDEKGSADLQLIQINHGIRKPVETLGKMSPIVSLWAARDAPVAALACASRQLFWLRTEEPDSEVPRFYLEDMQFTVPGDKEPSVAVDWSGGQLCCNASVAIIFVQRGERPRTIEMPRSERVNALAWLPDGNLLLGFETGEIHRASPASSSKTLESDLLFTVSGTPVSFATLSERAEVTAVAVGLASGRIELFAASSPQTNNGAPAERPFVPSGAFQLTAMAQRMMFLPNSPAARIRRHEKADDNGYSLAILDIKGQFEVLGFPKPLANSSAPTDLFNPMILTARHPLTHGATASVVAFSAATRRIAGWRNHRLEIRPCFTKGRRHSRMRGRGMPTVRRAPNPAG